MDLVRPQEIPENCQFIKADILEMFFWGVSFYVGAEDSIGNFDFAVASSPCEEFSIHGMPHFHPNPKHPEIGIELFRHAREMFEASSTPHVMENVRSAQKFLGPARNHCGPFYMWGTAVPPLMPQGIRKNMVMGNSKLVNELVRNGDREAIKKYRRQFDLTWNSSKSKARKEATAKAATIPPELANCIADYAERLLEPGGAT